MQLIFPSFTSSSIALNAGREKSTPLKPSSTLSEQRQISGIDFKKSFINSRWFVMLSLSLLSPSSLERRT
jgi:hypothetical protein